MTSSKTKVHTEYHKDGSVWARGPMHKGVPTGYWEWFRKDGTRMRSGSFVNGVQVGEWTTYDRDWEGPQSHDPETETLTNGTKSSMQRVERAHVAPGSRHAPQGSGGLDRNLAALRQSELPWRSRPSSKEAAP